MSAKNKNASNDFLDFILAQLAYLPKVRAQAMFGGFGLYSNEFFFAIVHKERFYIKVNADTLSQLKALDMQPFRPSPKQTLKSFYEVPLDILESQQALMQLVPGTV